MPAKQKKTALKAKMKKKNAGKISAGQKPVSGREVAAIKKKLETMRDDLLKRVQDKKSFEMPEQEVGDGVDQASQSLEKEILFEVADNDHLMLEQIESALRKMEKNSYGICESCHKPIARKRLDALPAARYCLSCQTSNESMVNVG